MTKQAALLLAYTEEAWETTQRLRDQIAATLREAPESPEPLPRNDTVVLGYALHNMYSALEDLFEHIARTFENTIEDPARFHAELLKRMKLDVYKVRPAFLSSESFGVLNELRAFRHVFRHAYGYELDGSRVRTYAVEEKALLYLTSEADWHPATPLRSRSTYVPRDLSPLACEGRQAWQNVREAKPEGCRRGGRPGNMPSTSQLRKSYRVRTLADGLLEHWTTLQRDKDRFQRFLRDLAEGASR